MKVDIQLEAAAEALDHRHRAGPAVLDAVRPRGAGVGSEQRPGIHAQHGAAQGVIPRQAVAQAIRQRQYDSLRPEAHVMELPQAASTHSSKRLRIRTGLGRLAPAQRASQVSWLGPPGLTTCTWRHRLLSASAVAKR